MTRVVVRDGVCESETDTERAESWLAAARRIAAPDEPVADDLSGDCKLFAVDHDLRIVLRPMTRGDLADVLRWRQADHVQRWFGGRSTLQEISDRYGPRIDGDEPTRMSVVEVNGRSIGFIQDYVIKDYPEYAILTPDADAIGGDYLIGEPSWIGRGIGTRLIWTWLTGLPDQHPASSKVFVAPDHRNTASLRILAKTGFEQGVWFDEPQRDGTVATLVGCALDLEVVIGR
ncbi:acetyltransferase [Microlunatus elymi]|uniref:Acetyltransferase n=1 Tax=Microlunatus elymi TaxID=2596828 RepID=A0A516Q3U4_9ACTN|nr:GNAT family N-acetyltransferase [Microlunatus elymi]QDP98084.1 acetyltransferase [Microlunatus elymi]